MKNQTYNDLPSLIAELIVAVNNNTEAIIANKGAVKTEQTKESSKTEVVSEEKKPTAKFEAVEAALLEVKAKHGAESARTLLKSITGSTSIKKIDVADYDKLLAACEEKIKEDVVTETDNEYKEKEVVDEKPNPNRDEMDSLIIKLAKNEGGAGKVANFDKARQIIEEVGKVAKKADIKDEDIDAVIEAVKSELEKIESEDL